MIVWIVADTFKNIKGMFEMESLKTIASSGFRLLHQLTRLFNMIIYMRTNN